jgi:heme-degrading monooxygenase HmoA
MLASAVCGASRETTVSGKYFAMRYWRTLEKVEAWRRASHPSKRGREELDRNGGGQRH